MCMMQLVTTITHIPRTAQITICQQNLNKTLTAQCDFLHQLNPATHNLATTQEPYLDHLHNACTTHNWYPIYPKEHYIHPEKTRLLIFINRCIATDAWLQVDFRSSDMTAIQLSTECGKVLII